MAHLIRKIDSAVWITEDLAWLNPGEVPSRALADVVVKKSNDLSLYRWDGTSENKGRIFAALAVSAGDIRATSYRILEENTIRDCGYDMQETRGSTQDSDVNGWHVDIKNMSGDVALAVAKLIAGAEETQEDLEEDDIVEYVANSLECGFIKDRSIPPKIKARL